MRQNVKSKHLVWLCLIPGLLTVMMPLRADTVTANWTGAVSTDYWNGSNWDIGIVPFDDYWDDYIANISSGTSVEYEMDVPIQLYGFYLAQDKTFNLKPYSDITVTDIGLFNGNINADNARFDVIPGGDYLITSGLAKFYVNNGGYINVPVSNVSISTTSTHDIDQYRAVGEGSILDLSSLTYLDAGHSYGWSYNYNYIKALMGGKIDFSGVETIRSPYNSDDRLYLICDSDSEIDLSSLRTINSANVGYTFIQTYNDWAFPSLQQVSRSYLYLYNDVEVSTPELSKMVDSRLYFSNDGFSSASFVAPSLKEFSGPIAWLELDPTRSFSTGGLTNIDGARFSVKDGKQWGAGDIVAEQVAIVAYDTHEIDQYRAVGEGSILDLSSLTYLDAGHSYGWSYNYHYVKAEQGGLVDLSSVETIRSPYYSDDRLYLICDSDSAIDLSSLRTINSANAGYTFIQTYNDWAFPLLQQVTQSFFYLYNDVEINAPELLKMVNSRLYYSNDDFSSSSFIAPSLKEFSGPIAWLELDPTRSFLTGGLTNIDGARFTVKGGKQWGTAEVVADQVTMVAYDAHEIDQYRAVGEGSILDLSSLTYLDAGHSYGWSYNYHYIKAEQGGRVDLSAVEAIRSPYYSDDRLYLICDSDSEIDLSSLRMINSANVGYAYIQAYNDWAFPSLQQVYRSNLYLYNDVEINTPELSKMVDSRLYFSNDELSSASFIAPSLKEFSGPIAWLELDPTRLFSTGGLTKIDGARFMVKDGKQWGTGEIVADQVAIVAYDTHEIDQYRAVGEGSILDLSSLTYLDAGHSYGWSYNYHYVKAEQGGRIDLSSVETIRSPYYSDDRLYFICNKNSIIDMSSLQTITSANSGSVHFYTYGNGQYVFDELVTPVNTQLIAADKAGAFQFKGELQLTSSSRLSLADLSVLEIGKHFLFSNTDESQVKMDGAYIVMNGAVENPQPSVFDNTIMPAGDVITDKTLQYLEAGGEDTGLPSVNEPVAGNFSIGQLVVGRDGQPTELQLLDIKDNGNRGTSGREALYLNGIGRFGGINGLRIRGGSVLVLGDLNVYARLNKQWVHLNSLFTGDETIIPFDEGYLAKTPNYTMLGQIEPFPAGDVVRDRVVDLNDFLMLSYQWFGADCYEPSWCEGADLNRSGNVDVLDLDMLSTSWQENMNK